MASKHAMNIKKVCCLISTYYTSVLLTYIESELKKNVVLTNKKARLVVPGEK